MRVGHAIRKSRNAYSSSSFTGILQFTYLSSFTTKPPQIADRTMLRFMLERRLLLLKPIYRPSAFSSEICCFSTKPNQAVSFTRGDGTSQRFYKDVDIGKDQGKVRNSKILWLPPFPCSANSLDFTQSWHFSHTALYWKDFLARCASIRQNSRLFPSSSWVKFFVSVVQTGERCYATNLSSLCISLKTVFPGNVLVA